MWRDYHLAERDRSNREEYLAGFLSPLSIQPGSTVVDLGCGSGYRNVCVGDHYGVRRNLGLELDRHELKLAGELAPSSGVRWICASGEAVPLPAESVDHLICRGVVPLVTVERVISEIARVLRPGGNAVILAHRWSFYHPWFSLRPGQWKRSIVATLVLIQGLWFHL